jgi:osmotically-inducible protein OsmY
MQVITSLKEKVEENLRQDSRLGDLPIEVLDSNGIITLEGEVPSPEISLAAENIARHTDGVLTVINVLFVRGDGT